MRRDPGAAGVRPPAVAGSWYPGDADALRALVGSMLAAVPAASPRGHLRALVVPHAGILYSGQTAAHGYARVRGSDFDRIVVLSPSHRAPLRGAAVDPSTQYETPLGCMPVDLEAIETLAAHPEFERDSRPFGSEHAIEMQLPFLQVVAPDARLVPVLVGELRGEEFRAAAAALQPLFDARTLVVVSSDFVHYGAPYGYVPFTDRVPERIRELDEEAIHALEARDAARFQRHLQQTGATICGRRPLGVLLELLRPGWVGDLCAYTTSGEITGDWTMSVSYACLAFHDAGSEVGPDAGEHGDVVPNLSPGERQALLFAARQALESLFAPPELAQRIASVERTPLLEAPSAAFVSLHRRRDGRLRGCIGTLLARRPLLETVTDNARAAAERDPRFPALRAEELEDLELEISVLGPLVRVTDPEEIVVGRDGVVVTSGLQRGVLLPQVATDQRWGREQFLEGVCRKAGLDPGAWKKGATLERFAAVVFGESTTPA